MTGNSMVGSRRRATGEGGTGGISYEMMNGSGRDHVEQYKP